MQPFDKVPWYLAAADVVVIPQNSNSATVGQIPAKIFDAMAMAKPIISTKISDIPEILDGCGWVVESPEPEVLAQQIQYVIANKDTAEEYGSRARERCVQLYSYTAAEKTLIEVMEKYRDSGAGKLNA